MKFTVEPWELKAATDRLKGVVVQRTTIPILTHGAISASGTTAAFTATDCDVTITAECSADVEVEGRATAPANKLVDIAARLPAIGRVLVEDDGGQLRVRAVRARLQVPTMAADDFPRFPVDGLTHRFAVNAAELARLLDSVSFSASREEARWYLNGVYLHAGDEALRAVSTDGNRLAISRIALPDGAGGMPGVIIPNKTAALLRGLLKGAAGEVGVSLNYAKIVFAIGDAVLASKVIDGTFPDYERIIPNNNDHVIEVDQSDLVKAIDLVTAVIEEKTRIIKIETGEGSLRSPQMGRAAQTVGRRSTASTMGRRSRRGSIGNTSPTSPPIRAVRHCGSNSPAFPAHPRLSAILTTPRRCLS